MKFRVVLEYDAEAKAFSAVCPELPGCASAGDTEEEARQNIKEAIELYLSLSNSHDIAAPDGTERGHGSGDQQFQIAQPVCLAAENQ
jgi:predicted RNase H-like HicB family nuclease